MLAELSNVEKLEGRLVDFNSAAVVADGGSGTMARDMLRDRYGIELIEGVWSATPQVTGHEEILYEIASRYGAAGAQILTANNFRTQQHVFERAGYSAAQAKDANRIAIEAVLAARDDVGNLDVVAAFSQAPMDDCYKPTLEFSFAELAGMHYEHAKASVEAGAELMIGETFPTINEARAALLAAKELGVKAIISFYCLDTNGSGQEFRLPNPARTESLAAAAYMAQELGAIAVATNCIKPSKGRDTAAFLAGLKNLTIPAGTWIQGHEAGCDEVDDGVHAHDYRDHVLERIKESVQSGARIIGGCCNIDDRDIEKMVEIAQKEAETKAKRDERAA